MIVIKKAVKSPGTFGDVVDPSLSNSPFMMDCASSKFLLSSTGPRRITSPAIHTDLGRQDLLLARSLQPLFREQHVRAAFLFWTVVVRVMTT